MLHVDLTLEDIRLLAIDQGTMESDPHKDPGLWTMRLVDHPTGETTKRVITNRQLAAILALAIAGDGDLPSATTTELYKIAEPALENLPQELRPIP